MSKVGPWDPETRGKPRHPTPPLTCAMSRRIEPPPHERHKLKAGTRARASLEEIRLDYEDFLRQHNLPLWSGDDPRRQELIDRRCTGADEVAQWVREVHERGRTGRGGQGGRSGQKLPMSRSTVPTFPEIAANAALVLLKVACSLLDRQIAAQAKSFETEGGFTERLYRVRTQKRSSRATPSTKSTPSTDIEK